MELQTDNAAVLPAEPQAPQYGRFGRFVRGRSFGLTAALLSLIVVLVYVFMFTPYADYLYSDMKSFWYRAMDRLAGKEFLDSQFVAWPPFYHIFLAELFRLLRWLGLEHWIRLETALTVNIVAYAISVYAFQRLAVNWFARSGFVLIVVLLYAVGFPALYFNAFLLSDNLGAALLVMAISVTVCGRGWWSVVAAGVLFAAATIIRPSLGPYGLAFVLFYLGQFRFKWQFFARAAVFSAIFFAAVFCASTEVSRISHGRVTGLSANGGLDFFIANADYHRVELNYDGWNFFIIVPSLSWKPEHGTFYTDVPFYNQDYYFQQGFEAIKRNPSRLWRNFEHVGHLFFADMLPSRYDAPGFRIFRPAWDWLKFGMFVTFGLYAWMWRRLEKRAPAFFLLISTVALTLLVSYVFTGEPRYTYSIIFVFYLLFFKLAELLLLDWRRWRKLLSIYAGVLLLGTAVVEVALSFIPDDPPTIALDIQPVAGVAKTSTQPQQVNVGRLQFPFVENEAFLSYPDNDNVHVEEPSTVKMHGQFEILGAQATTIFFRTYSSWPFRMFVDGRRLIENVDPDYFVNSEAQADLTPGMHDVVLEIDYDPREGGVAMNYGYFDKDWQVRQTVGLDSKRVRFKRIDTPQPRQ